MTIAAARPDASAGDSVLIPADHPFLHYSGRIDFTDPKSPMFRWPGTSVEARFHGSSVGAVIGDSKGENQYTVVLDGDIAHARTIRSVKGEQVYPFGPLPNGSHTILVFLRSETWHRAWFKGLHLSPGGYLERAQPPSRKIEFYAGSSACGHGNEGSQSTQATVSNSNAFLAFAAVSSRMLNADYRCIARSGLALTTSWGNDDFNMTDLYDRLDPSVPHSWDFKRWTPDVVVVNLGQNDAGIYREGVHPDPGSAAHVAAYKSFVGSLRAVYPDAWIVCMLGPMDAVFGPWKDHEATAVRRLNEAGDSKVCFLPIDKIGPPLHGSASHPTVVENQGIADLLVSLIRAKTGWQ